jgi:hypothetical protein
MTHLSEHLGRTVEATNYSMSFSFKNGFSSSSVNQKTNQPPKVIGKDPMVQS